MSEACKLDYNQLSIFCYNDSCSLSARSVGRGFICALNARQPLQIVRVEEGLLRFCMKPSELR